jgi:outer membrane protein OmpA-like peptidoglycan-associated protein
VLVLCFGLSDQINRQVWDTKDLNRLFTGRVESEMSFGTKDRLIAGIVVTTGFLILAGTHHSWAGDLTTSDEIIHALAPETDDILHELGAATVVTRSLTPSHTDSQQRTGQVNLPDTLRNRPADSLSPDERQRLAATADGRPEISVSVNFDYNSDRLGSAAIPAVEEIGKALASPKLSNGTFMVAGHTDAKGSDEYNQELSERRAESVKAYLVAHYQIPASNLIAVGYGKSKLKNNNDPFSAENRRVQIVNMSAGTVARQ